MDHVCNGGIPSAGRRRVRPRRSRCPFPWLRIRVSTRSRRNVLTFPQHFGKDGPTMQTIEMRALRAATVKPIGECGQPKLVSSGTREKRTMFAYVRLCSPMFAYVRLMGEKLLGALRAATADWGGAAVVSARLQFTHQSLRNTCFICDKRWWNPPSAARRISQVEPSGGKPAERSRR